MLGLVPRGLMRARTELHHSPVTLGGITINILSIKTTLEREGTKLNWYICIEGLPLLAFYIFLHAFYSPSLGFSCT